MVQNYYWHWHDGILNKGKCVLFQQDGVLTKGDYAFNLKLMTIKEKKQSLLVGNCGFVVGNIFSFKIQNNDPQF